MLNISVTTLPVFSTTAEQKAIIPFVWPPSVTTEQPSPSVIIGFLFKKKCLLKRELPSGFGRQPGDHAGMQRGFKHEMRFDVLPGAESRRC